MASKNIGSVSFVNRDSVPEPNVRKTLWDDVIEKLNESGKALKQTGFKNSRQAYAKSTYLKQRYTNLATRVTGTEEDKDLTLHVWVEEGKSPARKPVKGKKSK